MSESTDLNKSTTFSYQGDLWLVYQNIWHTTTDLVMQMRSGYLYTTSLRNTSSTIDSFQLQTLFTMLQVCSQYGLMTYIVLLWFLTSTVNPLCLPFLGRCWNNIFVHYHNMWHRYFSNIYPSVLPHYFPDIITINITLNITFGCACCGIVHIILLFIWKIYPHYNWFKV